MVSTTKQNIDTISTQERRIYNQHKGIKYPGDRTGWLFYLDTMKTIPK